MIFKLVLLKLKVGNISGPNISDVKLQVVVLFKMNGLLRKGVFYGTIGCNNGFIFTRTEQN